MLIALHTILPRHAGKCKSRGIDAAVVALNSNGQAGEEEVDEGRKTGAEGVRAVVNALHAEQPQAEGLLPAASKKRKGDAPYSSFVHNLH